MVFWAVNPALEQLVTSTFCSVALGGGGACSCVHAHAPGGCGAADGPLCRSKDAQGSGRTALGSPALDRKKSRHIQKRCPTGTGLTRVCRLAGSGGAERLNAARRQPLRGHGLCSEGWARRGGTLPEGADGGEEHAATGLQH